MIVIVALFAILFAAAPYPADVWIAAAGAVVITIALLAEYEVGRDR